MAGTTKMELVGAKQLEDELKKFGPLVSRRAANRGIRKAAVQARREFKAAAPKEKGLLRKSIKFKYAPRSRRAWVGLRERYYYKVLEYGRNSSDRAAGSPPMHKFFGAAWDRMKFRLAGLIVDETRIALYEEAGKQYIRTQARNRRR